MDPDLKSCAMVAHHVQEEEDEIFVKAESINPEEMDGFCCIVKKNVLRPSVNKYLHFPESALRCVGKNAQSVVDFRKRPKFADYLTLFPMNGSIKRLTDKGLVSSLMAKLGCFLHSSALVSVAFDELQVGDKVSFDTRIRQERSQRHRANSVNQTAPMFRAVCMTI